jgi:chemotaxis protein CheD
MKKMTTVGLGEMAICDDPDGELACLGLGSCVAVCAYDERRHLGALLHVVLPKGGQAAGAAALMRYADTAVPAMASQLAARAVRLSEMKVVLCGGAAIFPPFQGVMDIGNRNIEAVHNELQRLRVPVVKEELGGSESRTIILDVRTGSVRLRTVRTGEFEWIVLKQHR